jgi:hypothetical protein
MSPRTAPTRRAAVGGLALGLAQVGGGALLVARPGEVGRAVSSGGGRPPAPAVVRLLGARMLAQGIVVALFPRRRVCRAAGVVDGAHAASMLGLAAVTATYRRAALASAGVAVVSAASDWVCAGAR